MMNSGKIKPKLEFSFDEKSNKQEEDYSDELE